MGAQGGLLQLPHAVTREIFAQRLEVFLLRAGRRLGQTNRMSKFDEGGCAPFRIRPRRRSPFGSDASVRGPTQ
jgi:hypothetical protein